MESYFTGLFHADVGILFEILEGVKFYSGSERQKMVKHRNDGNKGSMNYGFTFKGFLKYSLDEDGNKIKIERTKSPYKGLWKTKVQDEYPYLEQVFKEFRDLYFSDFKYTNVQMNRNFQCPRHIDSKNVGESVLICLGDYTGGELIIENYPNENETKIIDNKNSIFRFNGSKYYHSVNDFEGIRYSLVFFKNQQVAKHILY